MQVLYSPVFYNGGCTVAMGTFDGVHIGHSAVIENAKKFHKPVVVVTTSDHPHRLKRILSPHLCEAEFEHIGVDCVIYFRFEEIKSMSPTEFLDMLKDKLNATVFCCGYNFRFGKNASGDVNTIKYYVNQNGLSCAVTEKVADASSTHIRSLLEAGDVEAANRLLGHNYAIDFKVSRGDKRGRTLDFPTINQIYGADYCLPKFGVYASRTLVDGIWYQSVSNIGIRPTFEVKQARCETYIIGFEGDLYGRHIKVEMLKFLREEHKFASAEQLKLQIEKDKQNACSI